MKIALIGYGRMGRAVEAEARAAGHEITARLDRSALEGGVAALRAALREAEVAIDFTVASQVPLTVQAACATGTDLVIGTTGWTDGGESLLRSVEGIGIVHGPNFSLGVQLFFRLAREAARLASAAGGYDAFVHEAHHRHKRDHPSGTAVRVADIVVGELSAKNRWEAGTPDGAADPGVLYVSSVRAGEVPGTHVLGIEGAHDRIELTHEARSRDGFALGAVRAAEWVRGRRGIFTFEEAARDLFDSPRS